MLTDRIYIDGVDAYTNYGLYVSHDDLAPLLTMPPFKKIDTTDWHEEDGLDADLSEPVLDSRQITLPLHLIHHNDDGEAQVLLSDLTSQVYHTFYFLFLDRTYTLRLVSSPSFAQNARFDTLSLTFAEDVVTIPTVAVPTQEATFSTGYIIDDADLSLYGFRVLQGTRDTFLKFASPKQALKVSVRNLSGVRYDANDSVRLASRDITINLHIRTASVSDFWARWYALWNAVLAPGERVVEGDGMTFRCYYKSNAVSRLLATPEGGLWCDFAITFAILAYSLGNEWFYLATEDGLPVIFEDDDENNPQYYTRIR